MSSVFFRTVMGAAIGFLLSVPVAAAEIDAKAEYAVTLGGTFVANATITLHDADKRYNMAFDAKIAGLAQLVASGTAKATSSGSSGPTGLRSEKFDILTRASGESFTVAITYKGANVDSFVVDPPVINNIDRVAIERKQLVSVTDMISGFVLKGDRLDKSLCDRTIPIFTGIERFNLKLRYLRDETATSKRTGYQGPVVLCGLRYTPISGHYTTSEITTYLAQSERILIWYAPLGETGTFIPYRAIVTTSAGDLSIVLTSLTQ